MPHERQEFVIIDYTKEVVILAVIERGGKEEIIGVGQYIIKTTYMLKLPSHRAMITILRE